MGDQRPDIVHVESDKVQTSQTKGLQKQDVTDQRAVKWRPK